jgi:hypothetical protein
MDQARRTRDRSAETAGTESFPQRDWPPHPTSLLGSDSANLDALPRRKPTRKSAQIRWLWPEISEALAAGHTIVDVRRELALDGIEISYSKLRTYVARLRRVYPQKPARTCDRDSPTAISEDVPADGRPSVQPSPGSASVHVRSYDPLANLRDRLTRRPGFQYDGRPPDEKKLI